MSIITVISRGINAAPCDPDALQNIIVRRQMAESAVAAALPRQGAGIALLVSERRALRAAMRDLSQHIDAEEEELNRIAHRHVSSRTVRIARGMA